jgi:hypothetical protein
MIRRLTSLAAASLLAASCAPMDDDGTMARAAGDRELDDCFFLSQVSGFNDVDGRGERGGDLITVDAGPRDTYLFETFGACPDLDFAETIAFDQDVPGQICSGLAVDLVVPTSIGPQRCPVRMIRKLSEEEEALY